MSKTAHRFVSLWLALCLSAIAQPVYSQQDEPKLEGLPLRSIGPAVMGGRIDDLAVVEDRPWIFYVGAASGGLWKTTNNGTTWTSLFDEQTTSSIADVALARSDPEIVWVGTGEANNRQSSSFGNGVYRSEDGGKTWEHRGLTETRHIGRVLIHPADPLRVYVAAVGNLWRASEERGVFISSNGGKTWDKTLFINKDTGVTDLVMDPVNPDILYAATYQRRRVPWGFAGGGPGSGLYKTMDGGVSWRRLSGGLPSGNIGRIGLASFRGDAKVVMATVEHKDEGGVYRSEDRGEHWTRVSEVNPRPMYYSKIHVDPVNSQRVYLLGSSFLISTDGGASFETNTSMTPTYDVGVHGDHHSLWIDPANTEHILLGGDGGLYTSWDRTETWDKINNIPLAQFYAIGVDQSRPYNIYAGAQDTHSWGGPSATRRQIGILNEDWFQTNFGDGMAQQVDPTDPAIVYTESQGGNIVRLDARTGSRTSIKPFAEPDATAYRFHWTSPILISPGRSERVYLGGNRLFISGDRGAEWTATKDLTWSEDRDELPIMGEIPDEQTLSRHDGVGAWGTITTISESHLKRGLLYVGTDDGRIQRSDDDGATWIALEQNLKALTMRRSKISRVAASSHVLGRLYVSVDRHHLGDFSPYVFVSNNFGDSWQSVSDDLPEAGWVNVIVEHPDNSDVLFAGTETGLFVSLTRGEEWVRVGGSLPTVPVDDLVIHPREKDLVVGTHGRSIYILDDSSPLAEYRADEDAPQWFSIRTATIFMPWKNESYGAQRQFVGENPPRGAIMSYYLREPIDSGVRIRVENEEGALLRKLEGPGEAGFHRLNWDLRTDAPEGVRNSRGILVPPGRYQVHIDALDHTRTQTVELVLDPDSSVGTEAFRDRFEFLSSMNALQEDLADAREDAEGLTKELQRVRTSLVENASGDDSLLQEFDSLIEELTEFDDVWGRGGRNRFRNPTVTGRAARLFGEFSGDDVRQGTLASATPVHRRRLESLRSTSKDAIARLEEMSTDDVQRLNALLETKATLRLRIE